MTALSAKLSSLVTAAGYGAGEGKRPIAELHRVLVASHGVKCSRTAVDYWLTGARSPKLGHLVALLNALAIPRDVRNEVIMLATPTAATSANRPDDADAHGNAA